MGWVFICVKNHFSCKELWTDKDFEIIAVEINSRDHKYTWEIVGLYRAPNDEMRILERLIVRTGIIGGDLNLPRVDWNVNAECNNPTQALVNRLIWDNGYSQAADSPSRRGRYTGCVPGPT